MKILLERHPGYLDLVLGYIAADPIRPLREFALSQYRLLTDSNPGVLHIIHGHGGGTEYHVRSSDRRDVDRFATLFVDRRR